MSGFRLPAFTLIEMPMVIAIIVILAKGGHPLLNAELFLYLNKFPDGEGQVFARVRG